MARIRFARIFDSRPIVLSLVLMTMAGGYLVFRYYYDISDTFPFAQEIILVFIGAVITVLITALLINQQTELELKKEGRVLLLDLRAQTYSDIIEHVGRMIRKPRLERDDMAELRMLNHKLSMVAGPEVLSHFNKVLDEIEGGARDGIYSPAEQDAVMRAIAELTFYMRRDLLGRIDDAEVEAEIYRDIVENNANLEAGSRHARIASSSAKGNG